MNIFDQLLADNQIPKFVRVRHEMDHSHIDDIEGAVAQAMRREGTLDRIKPGDSVCITAGSRDVANIEYQGVEVRMMLHNQADNEILEVRYRGDETYRVGDEVTLTL